MPTHAESERCATVAYGEDERHAGRTHAELESARVAVPPGLYIRGAGCESERGRGRAWGTPDDTNAVAPLLRHAYRYGGSARPNPHPGLPPVRERSGGGIARDSGKIEGWRGYNVEHDAIAASIGNAPGVKDGLIASNRGHKLPAIPRAGDARSRASSHNQADCEEEKHSSP